MAGGGFSDSDEDRTEAPSSHRREEFRRQGTVALSRELLSVAVLFAVGGALYLMAQTTLKQFHLLAEHFFAFGPVGNLGIPEIREVHFFAARAWGWMVAPVFIIASVAGLIASIAQVGFFITWEPLSPKWERLDPIAGFGRLFSMNGAMEAVKALFKLGIAALVCWSFLKGLSSEAGMYFTKSVPEVTAITLSRVMHLFFSLLFALSVLAGLDYLFQRYRTEKQMKTTRREAKDEFKLREGDPLIKSRIRNIQRKIASRRMMDSVPKADVIVTNPTHFAVALKYDSSTMVAPKVVAKGADVMAKRIRELAKFHRVPIVENKPLARTLYRDIEVGHSIPRELYKAVAEVLAYVYRLKRAAQQAAANSF